ncbi:MAG: hypothetical protein Kow0010_09900 [Dehalococcoidia bacterium]
MVRMLRRLRQNHALEHATVTVLIERLGRVPVVGLASFDGFWLATPVERAEVRRAAEEAIRRLHEGQASLAITDLCGSNIVVGAALATAAAFVAAGRNRWTGFPAAVGAASLALLAAAPAGREVQRRFTTDAALEGARITAIRERRLPGGRSVYHVVVGRS